MRSIVEKLKVIDEGVLGCKTVAFDEHASKRMDERGVAEETVLDVLRNPDQTAGLPAPPNRLRYRKGFGGRRIGVVLKRYRAKKFP